VLFCDQGFMHALSTSSTPDTTADSQAMAERVRSVLLDSGLDGTVFATRLGVPYSTMRAYLSGARAPSIEFITAAWRHFGIDTTWLLTGEGAMRQQAAAAPGSHMAEAFISVPLLPVTASAGPGVVNEPAAHYQVPGLAFSRDWITARRLAPQSLRVIEVRGASMEGVLSDGDKVLIDMSDTAPKSGFVYVLRQGDELLVKYCQLLPGGLLRVSSANPTYAPYDVDLAKTPDVQIVGRVVASMHEW
jgi:phage repressor protein C with HTH and peptisase S24 domain